MSNSSGELFNSNGLLAALPATDRALILPLLHLQPLPARSTLQQAFCKIPNIYFLQSGVAAVVAVSKHERRQTEVGLIGHEGMTGVTVVLGADRSPCNIVMQISGEGLQISARDLNSVMAQSLTLRQVFTRFAHVFALQTEHSALAYADGSIIERLARWLLMIHDRTEGADLKLTHEVISAMFSTQRPGITLALGQLSDQRLIKMRRGVVSILDRAGLEVSAQGLYGVPEEEYARLFDTIGDAPRPASRRRH